jgi:hypothetical protein
VIAHIVLFQPRADLTDDDRRKFVEALQTVAGSIPEVRRFSVGKRIKHAMPGYEQAMLDDYQFAAIVEFDDVDGLRAYLSHPAHQLIGKLFTEAGSGALAYDYDIVDASRAALLLD